jgi:hypothetical protein
VCPDYILNVPPEWALTGEDRSGQTLATTIGAAVTKSDASTEIYLWNLNLDRLIRVLRRLELQSIRPKQELKAYELRLEEIRASLNAGFSETMAARERADEFRLWSWRTALERQTKLPN